MGRSLCEINHAHAIEVANQYCRQAGINPDELPVFDCRYSHAELAAKLVMYREYIEIIHFFIHKFLSSISGEPIVIMVSDEQGYILEFAGDPTYIQVCRHLGIEEGIQFNKDIGTSSIDLCLSYQQPFQLIGEDHYHTILHQQACYTTGFHNENGSVLGTITLMVDIDFAHPYLLALLCTIANFVERELLLRRQNAQLQMLNQFLLGTNFYGVVITNGIGQILEMNERCHTMLQLDNQASYEGTSVFNINLISCYFGRAIKHHEECTGVELCMTLKDGEHHYMLDVLPVYDTSRSIVRVVGSIRDITEMKKTEELLHNTEKLVFAGQIAVSIAHEIRNPLTTVKGMLQLAGKDTELRHYNLIMSELERMNLIVSEFLFLGKTQAPQFRQERCHQILREVLDLFEIHAALSNITTECTINADHIITCDRNQIKQVFMNILKNAVEALPFGGHIRIVLDTKDTYQKIRFSDNGMGMNAEMLQRIGEPFQTTKTEGNGLGMMIVKKIIEAHKGRMVIESKVNEGTQVEIYLPIGSV
ncbi:ATP-binding protein [Paenibacillus sp.]|jgi:nitrogen-specific signal transduction histidine kinase|uniref:ATP-binding protein n=1 Tax=Paenibacillus sp. TaxID=58172 RepID=UPI00282ED0AD|nr:ATP-binding protein [Paenibacillus sp.]MDR0270449.1 PAS domain-containing sensor histidine kinase [Paenibacillus sp.]